MVANEVGAGAGVTFDPVLEGTCMFTGGLATLIFSIEMGCAMPCSGAKPGAFSLQINLEQGSSIPTR